MSTSQDQTHWVIEVHGWGTLYAIGTEQQAEEWRRHKANWERAVATKRPATDEEIGAQRWETFR